MLLANPRATREAYPPDLHAILNRQRAAESRRWLSHWSGIAPAPTPLHALPDLARRLGVADLCVKDESVRSPLGSFKALGAPVALVRLVLKLKAALDLDPIRLFDGAHADAVRDLTVVSATDGNHGRGLAAAAKSLGCACVIVLHAHVSDEREEAIARHGARIVRIAGNYDESVREAQRLATANGWHVVSDTSYEGYEEIPRDVMQGYGVIAAELETRLSMSPAAPCPWTHVVLQGGVGGLAAGIVGYLWELHGAQRPSFIVVEPEQADCLLQSAKEGRPARATGSVDSVMAGLACGEASPLAWRFLERSVDLFMTVPDAAAVAAMRTLAAGSARDVPIVAGESGAAGLAGLCALAGTTEAGRAGLSERSRVLLINSEGATAPALYASLVGEQAESVLRRQREHPSSRDR